MIFLKKCFILVLSFLCSTAFSIIFHLQFACVFIFIIIFLQTVYGYIILTQSEKFDFLIEVFSTFTFNIITEIIEYKPILLFLSSCSHCFFTPPFIYLFVYLYSYLFIYIMHMSVNTHVCLVLTEARRGCQIPQNWSYRLL